MNKEPKNYFKMSMLWWLVLFTLIILAVSILLAGLIWQIFMRTGVLPPFEEAQAIQVFLFLLFISIFIGAILSVIGGYYFMRPLHRLTMATKEIAQGNFNVHVNVKGSTELQKLAASFNEMAKELSSIETLRADFVSNVSHEFKTPVASIRGFAKRLLKSNLTEEQQTEYLKIIVYESERLSRLSGNVLLLSHLEVYPAETERETYPLDEQLRKLLLLLEPQIQQKRLETKISLEPAQITANKEMLRHVWLNLLGNAIKFSHHDGIIEITLEATENNVSVSISDKGIGMDSEAKKRMFEKFYQADTSRASEGSGLGLSLVKKIIDLENGRISVDSELGKGARFTVLLPFSREKGQ